PCFFFFQAEDGIRDFHVTGVQTCALPIYVRLLDGTGEFTAEVVSSEAGQFRFFAAPGTWTVRALSRAGTGQAELKAEGPGIHRRSEERRVGKEGRSRWAAHRATKERRCEL